MVLVGLLGCQKSEITKDKLFIAELKRIGATLQPGQSAKVPIPALEKNEVIIAVNGSYAVDGHIEPSEYVSKELAGHEIDYAGREGGNYIIYARDQKILNDTGILDENFRVSSETPPFTAKVAHVGTRNGVIRCIARETKPSSGLWNPRCRLELVAFE